MNDLVFRLSAIGILFIAVAAFAAGADRRSEPASRPKIVFFDGENVADQARSSVIASVRKFLNAAAANDRETARQYASQRLYKTSQEDRTKLLNASLDMVVEETSKVKSVFVLTFKDVQLNGQPAFATSLLFIDLGGSHANEIGLAPLEMIWFLDGEKPQFIVRSDFDTKITIETVK